MTIVCGQLSAASVNVNTVLQIGKACMEAYEKKLPQGFYNQISTYVVTLKRINTCASVDIEVQNTWHYRFRRVCSA